MTLYGHYVREQSVDRCETLQDGSANDYLQYGQVSSLYLFYSLPNTPNTFCSFWAKKITLRRVYLRKQSSNRLENGRVRIGAQKRSGV